MNMNGICRHPPLHPATLLSRRLTRRLTRRLSKLALGACGVALIGWTFMAYLSPDHLVDWLALGSLCS